MNWTFVHPFFLIQLVKLNLFVFSTAEYLSTLSAHSLCLSVQHFYFYKFYFAIKYFFNSFVLRNFFWRRRKKWIVWKSVYFPKSPSTSPWNKIPPSKKEVTSAKLKWSLAASPDILLSHVTMPTCAPLSFLISNGKLKPNQSTKKHFKTPLIFIPSATSLHHVYIFFSA